jgi:hypothetical protein
MTTLSAYFLVKCCTRNVTANQVRTCWAAGRSQCERQSPRDARAESDRHAPRQPLLLHVMPEFSTTLSRHLYYRDFPVTRKRAFNGSDHRLNMEIDLQSVFGHHVCSCTHYLTPATPTSPRIWAHITGRYWSTKIDDISF